MIQYDIPYTYENSSNPWLMDKNDDKDVLEFDGHKYTAKYLWSLNCEERNQALKNVFDYYRKNGFPYPELSDEKIYKEFIKLQKYDVNNVINNEGFISNSSNLCIDICKYFCKNEFYKASDGGRSVEDVFNDDELFIKVLKNRMGWNTSKEGGEERPYMFGISDKQILNGIRNSGLGYGVSNFRPVIGKWMYKHALDMIGKDSSKIFDYASNSEEISKIKIFDYSGGWGARMLAAMSLGCDYVCTDPSTHLCLDNLQNFFKANYKVYSFGSENKIFNKFNKEFDIIGSCPPYFDLEVYSNDENQSIVKYPEYENWLKYYWKPTVENCVNMLKDNGVFILVIKENHGKYELLKDMNNICENCELKMIEDWQYKSNTNHLSSKAKTGRTTKNNEHVLFYRKDNN